MEKDILSLISDESAGFSKGQKLIAGYILENYDKAAFMTAGKLGKTVGVSESTVVRFAAELGYDGYPGMRKALQEMIRNRLTSVQRIEVAREIMDESDILSASLNSDIEKIQSTLEDIDRSSFNAAVDAIISAKHVYIMGSRSSASLATFMSYYLNLFMSNILLVSDTSVSDVYEQMFRAGPGDVFLGISYPRYSTRTLSSMEFAKDLGATVIGITDGKNSPFVNIADIILFAKSDMMSFLDSLVAPLSLINALVVSVGLRSDTPIDQTFKKLEGIWSRYGVYARLEG